MKVLFVQPAGEAYGSEKSMLALLSHLAPWQAEVVCTGGTPLSCQLRQLGVVTHHLEFNKYAFPRRLDWHLGFYRRFRRILSGSRPDVVVINLDSNTPLLTLACLRSHIPIVRYSRFEFRPPSRWLDRFCWLSCSAIICPSEHVQQQVVRWAPPDFHAKVHHLYDPHVQVDISETQKDLVKTELGLHGLKSIVYVGRLHPLKRVEVLIRAVAEVRREIANARLLVIGSSDGSAAGRDYEQHLRELVAELGADGVIQFLGYRNDVPAVMAACDLLVLPSETESLGMVLLEAWSLRVPTVASDVAGCREITLASGAGLLCPVDDHLAMVERVRSLIMQPELCRMLGSAGADWVTANCDPQVYADRFSCLLSSLQNPANASGSTI